MIQAVASLIVFLVLRFLPAIEHHLGEAGIGILRKMFGIILLAIAIKMFALNIGALFLKSG